MLGRVGEGGGAVRHGDAKSHDPHP
jgi:hypothetical protein